MKDQVKKRIKLLQQLEVPDIGGLDLLTSLPKWQRKLFIEFWNDLDENNQRKVKEYFILVPKKNGKTHFAAVLFSIAFLTDKRPEALYILIAPQRESADNSFLAIRKILENSEYANLFSFRDRERTIIRLSTNAKLSVVVASKSALAGKKATGIMFDELWALAQVKDFADCYTEAVGGLMVRPEGFIFTTTTMSGKAPVGIFRDKLYYARDVKSGKVKDETFKPVLYEPSKEELDNKEVLNPANWYKYNPSLGSILKLEDLMRIYNQASYSGGDAEEQFYAKHLNIELGAKYGVNDFLLKTKLQYTAQLQEILDCKHLFIGFDNGGLTDYIGLAIMGISTDRVIIFAQGSGLYKEREQDRQYSSYSGQDFSYYQNLDDAQSAIVEVIKKVLEVRPDAQGIFADNWKRTQLEAFLRASGVPKGIQPIQMNSKLSIGGGELQRLCSTGKLVGVEGNHFMRNCIDNVDLVVGNSRLITFRKKTTHNHIDGFMALLSIAQHIVDTTGFEYYMGEEQPLIM